MVDITLIPNENVGTASMQNGSALILDQLLTSNCRLSFPKLPDVQFWLQGVSLPQISINNVIQSTRYVDANQVGEKINFSPFTVNFTVDKYMKNWASIYNWMKSITVQGSTIDLVDEPVLIINNTDVIKFIGAWPTTLGNLSFDATAPEATYMKCSLTINYDYIDLVGQWSTIDSSYTKNKP